MQKIRTFWHVLRHSLIPFDYYYHKLRTTRPSFSFRYFLVLVLVTVFITTSAQFLAFATVFPKTRLQSLVSSLTLQYPDDFIVTITPQGRLTTNYDKPFILFSPLSSNPMPLIVVDPKAQADKLDDYATPILMTEGHVYTKFGSYVSTYDYKINEPMKITHALFIQWTQMLSQSLESYTTTLIGVFISMYVLISVATLLTHIVLALAISCVTWVIYAILFRTHQARRMIAVNKLIQISFHTMTAPLILACIFVITPLTSTLPFWYFGMNVILLTGGVYEAYFAKKETHLG